MGGTIMSFNNWLDTFISEKGIDLEEYFEVQGHMIPYGVVIEHIKITTEQEQKQIRDIIVKIDFRNGDIRDFFRHLGLALAENYNKA